MTDRESRREAILEAKRRVAALPAWRRAQLEAEMAAVADRARFQSTYVRPA